MSCEYQEHCAHFVRSNASNTIAAHTSGAAALTSQVPPLDGSELLTEEYAASGLEYSISVNSKRERNH